MIKKLLFYVVLFLLPFMVLSQSLGDYKSNVTAGNWTALSSWQYYNGTVWVTPSGTSPQGYPGQFTGTGAVLIQAGNTITMGTADLTTQAMGTLTISGTLYLDGGTSGVFTVNTQTIIITSGLTPYANISFANKVTLALPINASIQVGIGGLPTPGNGTCNNNIEISIGGNVLAYCSGTGSPKADYTFTDIINNGGYNYINATANPSSICSSGSSTITALSAPSSGAIYKWYDTPTGGTPLNSAATYTTPSISTTTTYYVSATYTSPSPGYTTVRKAVTVTVNPTPVQPTITATAATCSSTGSTTISNYNASNTYAFTPVGPTVGALGLVSGMVNGTSYTVTSGNGSCTSLASANFVINPIITNIWTGSWSTGFVPTINQNIVFNGNFSQNVDVVGCSCEVKSGMVTISSGKTMTLTNGLTVSGGSLTFENTSSLVQVNGGITNLGNIIYKRQTNAIVWKFDYTYWSSPVFNQSLINVSPNTALDKFYSFNAATDSWVQESSSNLMSIGKGYIIRGPNNFFAPRPPSPYEAIFIGVPNNGSFSIPITTGAVESSYLIGNPYPSALDANSFINANSSVIDGTLYFWTHNTAIQQRENIDPSKAGSGAYAYTSDDYASYNLTGGVATTSTVGTSAESDPGHPAVLGNPDLGLKPTGKIGSGQGFFVTSIAAGNIVFNNSMRLGGGAAPGNNSQFFKIAPKGITVEGIEKNRVWLNLTNSQGAFKQTLVGYVSGATNDFDNRYDGESFDANEFIDFYSVNDDKNLVIQGRALPFVDTDEVPLGYSSTIAGDFTISIDQVDGLFSGKGIYLKDNMTNSIHNLNESAYDYKTEIGTFNDRFTLRYTNTNKTLVKEDFELPKHGVLISNKNKEVKVNSSVENIEKVLIYDMLGRQVYKNTNVNNKDLVIRNIQSAKQILLVKVELQNGQSVTQKIVY